MKKLNLLIFFLFLYQSSYGQIFNEKEINWNLYITEIEDELKLVEINKIQDDLMIFLNGNNLLEKYINNFHLLDYNADGNLDFIYSGDAGTDTKRTLIFELINGVYVKTFDKFGEVISLVPAIDGIPPYLIVLKAKACCSSQSVVYEIYNLSLNNAEIELVLTSKYSTFESMYYPNKISKLSFVKTINESSRLRLEPILDDDSYDEDLRIEGNILAEIDSHVAGLLLGSQVDESGKMWSFVLIYDTNKSLNSIFEAGENNDEPAFIMGWMDQNDLE